jgi:ribosomal protein S12 methylthiotransferase accessory factor
MDDNTIYPEVDLNSIENVTINSIVNRFRRSQIPLIVKDITSDLGIPTFIASSAEWVNHEYGYLVEGHGTHPDARIALMRAITEVSQSRAANIQGSRDDLRKMKYDPENNDENRSWQFIKSKEKKSFSEIRTFSYDDILDDIKLILNNLKARGLTKAIVVNLTNSKLNIPVIRVIVPGLETFKINKAVIGRRAKESVKKWLGPNL